MKLLGEPQWELSTLKEGKTHKKQYKEPSNHKEELTNSKKQLHNNKG